MKLSAKTTKKALALSMAAAMMAAATIPVCAATITSSGESGSTTVTYDAGSSFTLTIPSTVELSSTSAVTADVTLTDVTMLSTDTLKVTVAAGSDAKFAYQRISTEYEDIAGWFLTLSNTDDSTKSIYSVVSGASLSSSNAYVFNVTSSDFEDTTTSTATLTFSKAIDNDSDGLINAGSYSGTLVFTATITSSTSSSGGGDSAADEVE